jgi:hypothetical protein
MDRTRAGRTPALEHPLGSEPGEDANQRDATGSRDMSTRGIIANVQMTSLDVSGEAREGTVPHRDAWAGASDRAFDTIGLFATSAPVD